MKRNSLSLALALVAVLSLSAMAYAYGPGMGAGNGRGGCGGYAQNMTPEQQEQFDALHKDFIAKTEPLRQEIYAKHMELEALLAAVKTDKAKVDSVTKELVELKGKMFTARTEFREKLAELGIHDFGRGGRGFCGRGGMGFKGNCPGYNQGDCPGVGRGMGPRDGSGPCGDSADCPANNG